MNADYEYSLGSRSSTLPANWSTKPRKLEQALTGTDSDYGEYLANGVHLYKLYALVNGEWVVSEVKKLAILR